MGKILSEGPGGPVEINWVKSTEPIVDFFVRALIVGGPGIQWEGVMGVLLLSYMLGVFPS